MGAVGAPTVYGDRGGMIKIVGDKKYGELLGGAHRVGAKAADLIQELVVARDLEGGYTEVARTDPPAPDVRRGRAGGRPRRRRLADPRLRARAAQSSTSTSTRRTRGSPRSGSTPCCPCRRCGSRSRSRSSCATTSRTPWSLERRSRARRASARSSAAPPSAACRRCAGRRSGRATPTPSPAMRAATFAAEIGKVVAFSLAAFRQAFNAGRAMCERRQRADRRRRVRAAPARAAQGDRDGSRSSSKLHRRDATTRSPAACRACRPCAIGDDARSGATTGSEEAAGALAA